MKLTVTKWADEFHLGISVEYGIWATAIYIELGWFSIGMVSAK